MQPALQARGVLVWTPEMVEERLAEFFDTLARLPDTERPAGYRAYWPDMRRNRLDVLAVAVERGKFEDMQVVEGPPDPGAIDRMVATYQWFVWLSRKQIHVIRDRLQAQFPWWRVAAKSCCSERTAQRRFAEGMAAVVKKLNEDVDKSDKTG